MINTYDNFYLNIHDYTCITHGFIYPAKPSS